jgi:hypothetical protein
VGQGGGGEEDFLPAGGATLAFAADDGRVASGIANFFVVYTAAAAAESGGRVMDRGVYRAVEVLLHFCVNTYRVGSVVGGVVAPGGGVVHSATLAVEGGGGDVGGRAAVRLRSTGTEEGEGVYSVKRDDVRLLNGYLASVFAGTYSARYGTRVAGQTGVSEALGLAMFGGEEYDDEGMRAVVRNMAGNVATGWSNAYVCFSCFFLSAYRYPWVAFFPLSLLLLSLRPRKNCPLSLLLFSRLGERLPTICYGWQLSCLPEALS